MIHLRVPKSQSLLAEKLKAYLSLASEQGFNISNIELGVSSCELVVLAYPDSAICFSDNSNEISNKADVKLCYLNHQNLPGELDKSTLYIGAQINDQVALPTLEQQAQLETDIWCHITIRQFCQTPVKNQFIGIEGMRVKWSRNKQVMHSAWFLIALALEFPLEDALTIARAAVLQSESVSRETWPCQSRFFPQAKTLKRSQVNNRGLAWLDECSSEKSFLPLADVELGLYPVVDNVTWIERLLKLGITTIQLRIKDPSEPTLEAQITQAIKLGREYKAQVFINDYWQLAIKHAAYGVHLGQEDIYTADLSAIRDAGIRLGISTHSYYEIQRVHKIQPSYIALGHIFPTSTKQMPSKPQGLTRLRLYQKLIGGRTPTVAIGGIDLDTASEVWRCGVTSLAVVRAITEASDIALVIKKFTEIMKRNRDIDW